MAEEIFSGEIKITLSDLATGAIKDLASTVESSMRSISESASDFSDSMEPAVEKIVKLFTEATGETRKFKTQFNGNAAAIAIAMEPVEMSVMDAVSSIRLGLSSIGESFTDTASGISMVSSALSSLIERSDMLKGLAKPVEQVGRISQSIFSFVSKTSRLFGKMSGDIGALSERMGILTTNVRVQAQAWREMEADEIRFRRGVAARLKELTELSQKLMLYASAIKQVGEVGEAAWETQGREMMALRALLVRLGAPLEEYNAVMNNLEKGILRTRMRMDDLGASLKNQRTEFALSQIGLDNFSEKFERLISQPFLFRRAYEEMSDDVARRSGIQSKLITRMSSALSTMATNLGYVESRWRSSGEISVQYLERARSKVKEFNRVMMVLRATGGEVPEELAKNFKELQAILQQFAIEAKRLEQGRPRRRGIFGIFRKNVDDARLGVESFSAATKDATSAQSDLLYYVAPKGMMSSGISSLGNRLYGASESAAMFGMSLGATIGIIGAVGGALGQIDPAFSMLIVGAGRFADQLVRSFTAVASVSGTLADKFRALVTIASSTFTALGLGMTGLMVKTGMLGAEVRTLEMTMRTVATNIAQEAGADVGKFTGYVDYLRDTLVDTGITTREATKALTQFLRARLPVDKVEDLAQAAKNLGVTISNLTSSEVFGRFIYFIQTGNSQLLNALGIGRNAIHFYQDYAKEIGKSVKALTQQERYLALINGLLKEANSVQGVYNEAMKTAGKQLSSMKRLFEESLLVFGRRFEPILAKLIFGMNKLLKSFVGLPENVKDMIANFVKWGAVAGTLLGAIMSLAPAIKALVPLIRAVGRQLAISLPWMIAISAAIAGIIAVVRGFKKLWDENFAGIKDSVKELLATIKSMLAPLIGFFTGWFKQFALDFENIVRSITERLKGFVEHLSELLQDANSRMAQFVQSIVDNFGAIFMALHNVLGAINKMILGDVEGAKRDLKDAFINLLTAIKLLVDSWISQALVWGWNLVASFAEGMLKAADALIEGIMKLIGGMIGAFLASHSPPKKGPLSHIVRWGRGVMMEYLKGFALADFSVLRDIVAPIRDALRQAVSAGAISEKRMPAILRSVRKDVAQLLSVFRQTGQVSEEIIAGISKKLGEGGAEIVEYIRRILRYQQAVNKLKDVQEQVAAAERAGFVPKELQEKLRAAENEVNVAKEAVDWQRELIAAQRETIDLQLKQTKLLERMAKAMEKAAVETDFKLDFDVKDDIAGMLDNLADSALSLSDNFYEARKSVEEFLALPVEGKLKVILKKLLDIVGVELPEDWDEMSLSQQFSFLIDEAVNYIIEKTPEWAEKLSSAVMGWVEAGIDKFKEELAKKGEKEKEKIGASIGSIIPGAISVVRRKVRLWSVLLKLEFRRVIRLATYRMTGEMPKHSETMSTFFSTLFEKAIELFVEGAENLTKLVSWAIGSIIGLWLTVMTEKLPELSTKLKDKLVLWFTIGVLKLTLFVSELAEKLLDVFTQIFAWFIALLEIDALKLAQDLIDTFVELILKPFLSGVLKAGPEWLRDAVSIGAKIANSVKEGIKRKWGEVTEWFRKKLQELRNLLPFSEPKDKRSPLYGLSESGKAIVHNMAIGMRDFDFQSAAAAALSDMKMSLSDVVSRPNTMNFYAGAFSGAFPNITRPEDAGSFMEQLNLLVSKNKAYSSIGVV